MSWSTVLGVLSIALAAALVLRAHQTGGRRAWLWHLAAGLTTGFGALVRPNMLAFYAAAMLWLLWLWLRSLAPRWRTVVHAACFSAGMSCRMPWVPLPT